MNPEISVVIPSTGSITRLERCLDSLIENMPRAVRANLELIIFLNTREKKSDAMTSKYISDRYGQKVPNLQIKLGNVYKWTAEESAFEASQWASKEYIWIIGDQRIFLPEGLEELERVLKNQNPEGVFFNNTWVDNQGLNLGMASLSTQTISSRMNYKDFVLMTGYNYMPTNFGSFIVKREYLNRDVWLEVVANSGWHFSHVATYMLTMSGKEIVVSSKYLIQMEVKDYHIGDNTGWEEYARKQKKIRFSTWVETLPKQLNYLIQKEAISHHELRVALINEGEIFKRLIDELYQFAILQMKLAIDIKKEKLPLENFLVIKNLLKSASPERVHANQLLDQMFFETDLSKRKFRKIQYKIEKIIAQDSMGARVPLVSLIVGSSDEYLVRIHPSGYVISRKNDSSFLEAFRVLNKSTSEVTSWILCRDEAQIDEMAKKLSNKNKLMVKEKRNKSASNRKIKYPGWSFRKLLHFLLRHKIFLFLSYRTPLKLKSWLRRNLKN